MGWRGIKFKRKECFCWESNHTTNKTKPTQTSITNCRSAHRWDIHCSFHDINKNLHCVTWRCQVWCAEILQQRPCCWVQVSPRVLTSLKPTVKGWLTECWSPALQSSSWSSLLFPLLPTTKNSTKRRKNTPSSISDFSWHFRRSNNLCTPRKSREDAECSFSYTLLDFKVWNLFTSNIWIHHKLLFAT